MMAARRGEAAMALNEKFLQKCKISQRLQKTGVPKRQIVFLNFEEIENDDLLDSRRLYAYLKSKLVPGKTVYFFLDEIQRVSRFEEVLDSLHVKKGVDLYVTDSNARMFSSEIATVLTGRYVELNVLPFSFAEVRDRILGADDAHRLSGYLAYGALPETFAFPAGSSAQRQYMESVYNTILSKDVLKRNAAGGRILVDAILRYMIDNIGNLTMDPLVVEDHDGIKTYGALDFLCGRVDI